MKKYELTNRTKIVNGVEVCRTRALRDFANIKAGDLGGFIQSEENLSHGEDCWIDGEAVVFGGARVYGDARVLGNARVFGNAVVYGNARVFGGARVYGNAEVYDTARVYGNAEVYGHAKVYKHATVWCNAEVYGCAVVCGTVAIFGSAKVSTPVFIAKGPKHHITITDTHTIIGCEIYPHEHWIKNIEKIGMKHKYTKEDIKLYKLLVFGMIERKIGKTLINVT